METSGRKLKQRKDVYFKVDKRAVRDRHNSISKDLRKKLKDEEKASGIESSLSSVIVQVSVVLKRTDGDSD